MPTKIRKWIVLLLLGAGLAWQNIAAAQQVCRSESEIPSSTPTGRFTDQGNGTVTDGSTGLMWAKCAAGLSGALCEKGTVTLVSWQGALGLVAGGVLAGYNDWRLPNVKELRSIVELRCYRPSINQDPTVFPNTPTSDFWSSSPQNTFSLRRALFVNFNQGFASANLRDDNGLVRMVRYGQ